MKISYIIRENKYVILLFFLVIFTFRNILFYGGTFGSWDSFGGHAALISFVSKDSRFIDIWSDSSFGYVVPIIFIKLLGFLTPLFGDAIFVFNFTVFFSMLGSAIGMYFFTLYFSNNKIASFVSAFIFIFNPWIVNKYSVGHLEHTFSYFLLPLLFFYLYRSLDTGKLNYIILYAAVLSLFPLMRLDPLYYVFPVIVIFLIVYSIFNNNYLSRVLKVVFVSLPLFIIFTVYIFLPIVKVPTIFNTVNYSINELDFYSLNLFNTLLGDNVGLSSYLYWSFGISWNSHPFLSIQVYKLIELLIPLIALSAIMFRKNFIIICFTVMALISVFLAKGPEEPLNDLYIWGFNNLPYFSSVHVPNRWLMITWFTYAFLTGTVITEINHLIKRKGYKLPNILNAIFILIIISSILISSFYIFSEGYENYKFPHQETEPHIWLGNNESEYRIVTVPFSQTYAFLSAKDRGYDFGKSSYYFHKKAIINTILDIKIYDRIGDFAEFNKDQINKHTGNKLSKVLGIYDVRYFVLQGYPPTSPHITDRLTYNEQDYFESQKGLVIVFEGNYTPYKLKVSDRLPYEYVDDNIPLEYKTIDVERPAKIFENSFWTPRIFTPQSQMLVIGGLESFSKLAEIDNFNFSNWNLLFADDLAEKLGKDALVEQINSSDHITFINSEPLDLAMILTNTTWIRVKNFENDSVGWKEDNIPITEGFFVYNRDVVTSRQKDAKAIYKVKINNKSNYEVWIRAFLSNKAGKLKIFADGSLIGEVEANTSQKVGFKWIKISDLKLENRNYEIEVVNENGENKLNGITIVKKDSVNEALDDVKKLVDGKSIYLLETGTDGKSENTGENVISYTNNTPIGIPDIRTEENNSVKYLDFKEIRPSKWVVKVNSTAPYTLVFSNTYHPMWRAYVNGKEYNSLPSYYFINSFQINETGEHEVIIEFIGQRIQNIGLLISGFSYLGCFGYLFYDWRRKRGDKWTHMVKNKLIRIIKRTGNKND